MCVGHYFRVFVFLIVCSSVQSWAGDTWHYKGFHTPLFNSAEEAAEYQCEDFGRWRNENYVFSRLSRPYEGKDLAKDTIYRQLFCLNTATGQEYLLKEIHRPKG